MTSTEELKPCPFCGGTPELLAGDSYKFACIYCPNCGVRTHVADDAKWAALKWNERRTDAEIAALVATAEAGENLAKQCRELDEDAQAGLFEGHTCPISAVIRFENAARSWRTGHGR